MTEQAPDGRAEPPTDADPSGPDAEPSVAETDDEFIDEKVPFGFILTLVLAGLYLAWRLIQGLVLLFDWLF